jgi:DNA-binding beta-propeller fold protein YncE/ABC-type molybdate transport system permease subunit
MKNPYGLHVFFALAWLAFLLPGVLLGIGLIHAFNHNWSAFLYQGAGIVILSFVIRYAVIGCQATWLAVRRTDPDLVEVALLEGANRWQLLRHVLWPQITRPVIVAWYIVFLLCLWDVESMILVVPPGGETLALRIFNLLHYGHNSQVNALCLTLLAVAMIPLLLERGTRMLIRARREGRRKLTVLEESIKNSARTRGGCTVLLAFVLSLFSGCGPGSNQAAFQSTLFKTVQIIGVRGVGVGQLNKPRSVSVDSQDNLFVVDMTGRVQKFSPQGSFVLSWQMPQTDRGKPKGMNHDHNGNIFVVEPHYSRVNLFSPLGQLILQWGNHGTNAGELTLPRAVAENSRGEIFVSEYQEIERVQRFSYDPHPSRAVDGAKPNQTLHWSGGFGTAGTAPGEFNRPEGLGIDSQDRVYVADSCNHRIQIFDRDGKFLRAYGKAGSGPGELSYPYDICIDKEGHQYVCEFGNSRIQVFDAQDRCLEIIGGPGVEPGRFNNPWGVALDSAGNLYVADSQNHRVQKLLRK